MPTGHPMKTSLAAAVALGALCLPALATGGEIGLAGIEVGVTSCWTLSERPDGRAAIARGRQDALTRGVAFDLSRGAFGLSWVRGGHVSCDPVLNTVEAVTVEIEAAHFGSIVAALGDRFPTTEKVLPVVGDCRAVFVSESGETIAVVSDPHLADAELSIQTAAYHEFLTMRAAHARTYLEGFGQSGNGG